MKRPTTRGLIEDLFYMDFLLPCAANFLYCNNLYIYILCEDFFIFVSVDFDPMTTVNKEKN